MGIYICIRRHYVCERRTLIQSYVYEYLELLRATWSGRGIATSTYRECLMMFAKWNYSAWFELCSHVDAGRNPRRPAMVVRHEIVSNGQKVLLISLHRGCSCSANNVEIHHRRSHAFGYQHSVYFRRFYTWRLCTIEAACYYNYIDVIAEVSLLDRMILCK